MPYPLKYISDQVMVITGASSGIGLATAYMAARQGAQVVLVARNEAALVDAVERIRWHRRPSDVCRCRRGGRSGSGKRCADRHP